MQNFTSIFSEGLAKKEEQRKWLESHRLYIGDLHNHCNISYGHGSLEKAIAFAQQQLDFFTVTGHFAWPDMDSGLQPVPPAVQEYHNSGFEKLRTLWPYYQKLMKESGESGIVPFASYEFHSFVHGDYTIIVQDLDRSLPEDPTGEDTRLVDLIETNDPATSGLICMPHHIGYKTGFRGINWETYREHSSPLVEIMSMHGASESEHALPAYLHTMGPLSQDNTYQGGLARGFKFGVTACTDHHNAAPGSYGSGKTGVWATEQKSDEIWDALLFRQTVAYSGDPIAMAYFIEDQSVGSTVITDQKTVNLDAYVLAPSSLARVEVLVNNEVYSTHYPKKQSTEHKRFDLALGWGQRGVATAWELTMQVEGARFVDVVGRLRGEYVVDPLSVPSDDLAVAPYLRHSAETITLSCRTAGNTNATTDDTQGLGFGLVGDGPYTLHFNVTAQVGEKRIQRSFSYESAALQQGTTVEYMDGFVSPALRLSEEMDISSCAVEVHQSLPVDDGASVYLRAFEEKGDSAWSSAIWVERP